MSASISKDEAREKENEQVTAVAIEDVDKDAPEHPAIPRLHYWTVVTALSLYSFVAMLDATIIISTLPTILPTFHVPVASSISWLVSGCVLTTAIFLPIVSKLCDIVGSKRTFLTTVLLYIVGTTLGGASTSFKMMLIARFIQGIGIAGAVGLTMIIVARMAGTEALGQAFILFGASMTCGSMAGAPLGGVITEHLGWRWTFYISLPIAALAAILVIAFLRVPLEPGKKKAVWRDIDYGGALLFTTSATTFLLPTIWGGDDFPWNSAPVISCYVVSAVTLAAFVYWEAYHARDPFLPMNLFRNRTFVIASFIQLSTGAMMTVLLVYSVLYLQLVRGKSQLDTSLLTTPYMVAATISGCAVGAVNQRFKVYREPTIVGLALFIVGAGVCLTWSTGHSPTVDGLLLIPAGFAGGLAACGSLLGGMQSVDPSQLAPATGFIDFSRCIGGAIGVAIASAAATNASLSSLSGHANSDAMQKLFKNGLSGGPDDLDLIGGLDLDLFMNAVMVGIRAAIISSFPNVALSLIASFFLKPISTARK